MTKSDALILAETDGHVGIIRLNRPKVLNALNPELMAMLAEQCEAYDKDENVHVILIAGSEKAWAAGADIGDMAEQSAISMYERDQFATWERIKRTKKPVLSCRMKSRKDAKNRVDALRRARKRGAVRYRQVRRSGRNP